MTHRDLQRLVSAIIAKWQPDVTAGKASRSLRRLALDVEYRRTTVQFFHLCLRLLQSVAKESACGFWTIGRLAGAETSSRAERLRQEERSTVKGICAHSTAHHRRAERALQYNERKELAVHPDCDPSRLRSSRLLSEHNQSKLPRRTGHSIAHGTKQAKRRHERARIAGAKREHTVHHSR